MSENEMKYETAPKLSLESVKKNEVIHCPTEAEAIAICKLFHDAGFCWYDGDSFINNMEWGKYAADTCYDIRNRSVCEKSYFEMMGYTVLPASDFLPTTRTDAPAQEGYTITPKEHMDYSFQIAAACLSNSQREVLKGVTEDPADFFIQLTDDLIKRNGFTVSHSAPTIAHDMD